MFVAVYKFNVLVGSQDQFQKAWSELTKLIYQYEGSLGSRLHSAGDGIYIAYAQWPSRSIWENSGSNLPEEGSKWREVMRSVCSKIETIHELEMTEDLLNNQVY